MESRAKAAAHQHEVGWQQNQEQSISLINHRDRFWIHQAHRNLYCPFFTMLWWKFWAQQARQWNFRWLPWPGYFLSLLLQGKRLNSCYHLYLSRSEKCHELYYVSLNQLRANPADIPCSKVSWASRVGEGMWVRSCCLLMLWLVGVEICYWNVLLSFLLNTLKIYIKPIVFWLSSIAWVL